MPQRVQVDYPYRVHRETVCPASCRQIVVSIYTGSGRVLLVIRSWVYGSVIDLFLFPCGSSLFQEGADPLFGIF
jgi:hypothetical protein